MSQVIIKQESFTTDYRAEALSAIFKKQSSDCDFTSSDVLLAIDSNKLISVVEAARQTLLVACDELRSKELIQAVMQKADKGIRVYLLLGDAKTNQTAIDTLSGRCLVRTGVKQKGALILVDHTTTEHQGLLLMGQETLSEANDKDWAVSLESQQLDDSFRSFCKLFWEDSGGEYLQQNTVQKKSVHPDGSIITNHSHQLSGTLEDCLYETLNNLLGVSDITVESEGISFQRLLGVNDPSIKQLAHTGMSLTDNWIPTLLLSDSGHWLLPSSPDFKVINWCLKLSDKQGSELEAAYNQAVSDAAWQFSDQLIMSDLSDKQQLRFADAPSKIQSLEASRERTLEAIYTDSIDSFLNDDAKTLVGDATKCARDFMAHEIGYQVVIHPPYCPSQANLDSLYIEWQGSEKNWQDLLVSLMTKQKSIDESQARISDRLKGFVKNFLLGQGQSAKKLNKEIDVLQAWSVTQATPAERQEYKNRLANLHSNIAQRGNDTASKVDEAEQNLLWDERKTEFLRSLDRSKQLVLETKSKQDEALSNRKGLEVKTDNEFYEAWREAIVSINDKQMHGTKVGDLTPEQFMPGLSSEKQTDHSEVLESARVECISKKREVLSNMAIDQALKWKGTFKDKHFTKHYSNLNRVFKSREEALKKIQRDCDEANNLVLEADKSMEHAQGILDAHGANFNYKSKNKDKAFDQQLGLKGNKSSSVSFVWPEEELPHYRTELRSMNKQRFLVISDLDDLEQARKDANRLNAKIVCDEVSINA